MSDQQSHSHGTNRRTFLAAGGAALLTSSLLSTASTLSAQGTKAPPPAPKAAKWRRLSLAGTGSGSPAKMLESYKKAIAAMLKLPPTDPRNWYRNALVHTPDCPHGNWWFLPWHRGYLGWFEQTCRKLSGDPSFALPFWDWTAEPKVPKSFWDGVLDPSNKLYLDGYNAFQAAFTTPITTFWNGLSSAQTAQLSARGLNTVADLLTNQNNDLFLGAMFPPRANARGLTAAHPDLDAATKVAVSLKTVQEALSAKVFVDAKVPENGFASFVASQHSEETGKDVLESQPHDNVHGAVGGFMGDFLSPVDPIFFMHHANIDRLWDVWTRKQGGLKLPTLPTGPELAPWQKETFLFYVDADGKPVSKNSAGDYATIGQFDYDYARGSADPFLTKALLAAAAPMVTAQSLKATVSSAEMVMGQGTAAQVSVPEAALRVTDGGQRLSARISVQLPPDARGARFHVLVNPPAGAVEVPLGSPHHAGTIRVFGKPHHGTSTFVVPLTEAVNALRERGTLNPTEALRIVVVPDRGGAALSPLRATLADVTVSVH